jgi:phage shock protein PspC (stress-responsive transcriptional regulator)
MSASNDPDPKLNLSASGPGRIPWYQDVRFISVLLVVVGLLALPLVWMNRTWSVQKKVVITIISLVIAALMFWASGYLIAWIEQEKTSHQDSLESLSRSAKI